MTVCGEPAPFCGEPGEKSESDTPTGSDTLAESADGPTLPSVTESLPDLLSGHQVCELLNITKSTLGPWRAQGVLQAVPFAAGASRTTWRYPKAQPTIQTALRAAGRV